MKSKALLWMTVVLGLILGICHARASTLTVRLPNGLYVHKEVVSLREARFTNIVAQRYDLSCGSAALATILYYYYKDEVDERNVIEYMLKHGDQEKIAKMGFSLLDLKNYAVHRDYLAAGYKNVSIENLRKLKIPAIVLLKTGRYAHFVVLKGVGDDKAYLADPAFGNRSMPLEAFLSNWNGVIFLVVTKKQGLEIAQLPLDSTLPAPQMNVIRIQQMDGMGGFRFFRTPGEF